MYKKILIAFILFTISFTSLHSSGGMGGGGGPIPQGKDREKFHLGKAIYNQEIEVTQMDPSKEVLQAERLEYLQGSLPNPEKKRVTLPNFAGKLTELQLEALEYFISVRFNVKLEKK
jgi:hypothetical protein